jgi:hypothetical protein
VTPQSDEDEVWRQIVASFNDKAEDTSGEQPWPDRENVPDEPAVEDEQRPAPAAAVTATDVPDVPASVGLPESKHGADADADTDDGDDDHYVPPPPPPLPKADPATRVAWAALFGGPAYLLLAAVLHLPMDGWIVFAAVAAFIGGFVALVIRMGDGPPSDSGWNDGAVV